MGSDGAVSDPIHAAANIILACRRFEAELNSEVCSQPGFAWTGRPLQVTIAQVSGGGWIGSSPDHCLLVGNVGIAPGSSFEAIEARLVQLGRRAVGDDLALRWNFSTGLRNHPYLSPYLGHLQEFVEQSRSSGEHRILERKLRRAALPAITRCASRSFRRRLAVERAHPGRTRLFAGSRKGSGIGGWVASRTVLKLFSALDVLVAFCHVTADIGCRGGDLDHQTHDAGIQSKRGIDAAPSYRPS